MKRSFLILSILFFLGIVVFALLMLFGFLNPIIHLKSFIFLCSAWMTILSLGLFISRQEVNSLIYFILLLLLILPLFGSLMGFISPEIISNQWKLILGGTVFQIGTGIFALLGGFVKKGIRRALKVVAVFNYLLFLFFAIILVFDLSFLWTAWIFIPVGVISSVLSLVLVLLRKQTMSL